MKISAKMLPKQNNSLLFSANILALIFLCVLPGKTSAQNPFDRATLIQSIQNGSIEEKREALFQIRNLKSETASRLAIPALRDVSEIVRATATHSVLFLPNNEAVPVLVPLLEDESEYVRKETALALGQIGDPRAVSTLLKVLGNDKKIEVRVGSAIALGLIGDVSAIDELTQILVKKPKDKDEFLRRSAARSIGQIAQSVQTGNRQLVTPSDFLPEKQGTPLKPKHDNLLKSFPVFHSANETLINSIQNPKEFRDVKREAAFALGAIGDSTAIPVLTKFLTSEDYYLAEICKNALGRISQSGQ